MLILSLPIRVKGIETSAHWRYVGPCALSAKCDGCGSRSRAALIPVALFEDRADDPTDDGKPLCKACSMGGANLSNAEWPALTSSERADLWDMVAREQVREALCQPARERAVATTLDELHQATARALEQARVNQSIDRVSAPFAKVCGGAR